MIVAGITNVIIAFNTACNVAPTGTIPLNTAPPKEETITRETDANKNGVVSLPVTFNNPTINPKIISTVVATGVLPELNIPINKANTTPKINAQLPILATKSISLAISNHPPTFLIMINKNILIMFIKFTHLFSIKKDMKTKIM
jgi:hypothetical protein